LWQKRKKCKTFEFKIKKSQPKTERQANFWIDENTKKYGTDGQIEL
jgi:hypothetical protein